MRNEMVSLASWWPDLHQARMSTLEKPGNYNLWRNCVLFYFFPKINRTVQPNHNCQQQHHQQLPTITSTLEKHARFKSTPVIFSSFHHRLPNVCQRCFHSPSHEGGAHLLREELLFWQHCSCFGSLELRSRVANLVFADENEDHQRKQLHRLGTPPVCKARAEVFPDGQRNNTIVCTPELC